jgi:hypothetical protein
LVDDAEKLNFKTEEEAKAFFDKKITEWSKMKLKKRKVEVDEREKKDPYYAMLKEEKPITSRYSNHFDIDDEDYHSFYDQIERNIGRYPIGFRQYENFENYSAAYPDSTIQDYHEQSKD